MGLLMKKELNLALARIQITTQGKNLLMSIKQMLPVVRPKLEDSGLFASITVFAKVAKVMAIMAMAIMAMEIMVMAIRAMAIMAMAMALMAIMAKVMAIMARVMAIMERVMAMADPKLINDIHRNSEIKEISFFL